MSSSVSRLVTRKSVVLRGCEVCECILRYVEIRDVIEAVVLAAMRQLLRI